MSWYILHVRSGYEKQVCETIHKRLASVGIKQKISEILMPSEKVVSVRQGKKVNRQRQFFPGYMLLKMDMTDEMYQFVSRLPHVSGFLGTKGVPTAITEEEVDAIRTKNQGNLKKTASAVHFDVGEQIRICDGPFLFFNGFVEEVNEERNRLKVSVKIFGRQTPVELTYAQVEKL